VRGRPAQKHTESHLVAVSKRQLDIPCYIPQRYWRDDSGISTDATDNIRNLPVQLLCSQCLFLLRKDVVRLELIERPVETHFRSAQADPECACDLLK